jgi:hypothetical protein
VSVGRSGPYVEARTVLHRRRCLSVAGEVLLEIGDRVQEETVVARTPGRGRLHTINAARLLDILPAEVPGTLLHEVGAQVAAGQPLARTRGLWGLLAAVCRAPVAGVLAAVSAHTGRILLEEPGQVQEVRAFLPGIVTELVPERGAVVAGWAARVAGVFGVGDERAGVLRAAVGRPAAVLDAPQLGGDLTGCVLVGGSLVTGAALRRAAELGATGVITGGIHDRELADFLGQETVLADTTAQRSPLTLVVTGGFGRLPMDAEIFALLQAHLGRRACLVGRTRVRAGAERPEVIIPLEGGPDTAAHPAGLVELVVGCRVLVVRAPWFGHTGRVGRLPAAPCTIESEAACLVAEVDLDVGRTVRVPRANLEVLGGPAPAGTSEVLP